MILIIAFLIGAGFFVLSQGKNSEPLPVENDSQPSLQQADSISYQGREGVDALTLLHEAYVTETKDFGPGVGEFVEVIKGIRPAQDEFWGFFVNGEAAEVGASSYITKNNDQIEWRLVKIDKSSL
jgi:hypothetical protein